MDSVRRATVADVAELVRLRGVLLASIAGGAPVDDAWRQTATKTLRTRLDDPDLRWVGFVVEQPGRPGALAACAIGVVEQRLGWPDDPTGEIGYIFNVATDPAHRRRGHSRRCMTALLDWYRARGIKGIFLNASREGEKLYRELGFTFTSEPAMGLVLAEPDPGS
ncbi:MAG: GNAT family N-acetyltransferase [Micromonosporaceae bacterium]